MAEHAMVSTAFGAMNSVLSKLASLLTNEYKLLKGVKQEIMFLKAELESMQAFLKKMSEFEDELDEQVKCWMKEVRELSYDIDDCIDEFAGRLKYEPSCELNGISSFISRITKLIASIKDHHQISKEIRSIRARVAEVSRRHKRYKVDDTVCKPGKVTVDPRLPALYKDASELVGIDGPKNKLTRWLTEGESGSVQQLKVVSIVGSGGLGKTTLANQVYHNLEGVFECRAFVSVSHKPDMKKILRDILSGVGYNSLEVAWDEGKLIHELRKYLRFARYFVVIDDIWSASVWEILRCALPDNNCGSRIIATTRITDLDKSCCVPCHCDIYHLKPLDNVTSRRLFFKRIFGSEGSLPSQLKGVTEKILKKCGGMPLAIISIASLLATKAQTKEQWENVKNSMDSGLDNHAGFERMNWILSLSYCHLPQHLKTCMLYLCMFPEDYIISRDMLVQQWIAEGFICTGNGQSLVEVGYNYFNELINRSMIQAVDVEYNGEAVSCQVHDMIRSLIISKSNQENFVTILSTSEIASFASSKIRRLSLQYIDEECGMVPTMTTLSHVRSFSIFGHCNQMPSLMEFKVLRVLEMENCWQLENHHLKYIGRLSQLKYLGLRGTHISELPEQIGELKYLETLDLRLSHLKELPAVIVQLRRLARLFFDSKIKLPDGIGEMQALQELSSFDVCRSSITSIQELGRLANLRVLEMAWRSFGMIGNVRSYNNNLVSSLGRLGTCSLGSLSIQGYNSSLQDFSLDLWCPPPCLQKFVTIKCITTVPKWLGSLVNLSYVDVSVLRTMQGDIDILGEIPNLLFLRLGSEAAPHKRLIIHNQAFQSLNEFRFICLLTEGLEFQAGAMPRLQRLCFQFVAWEISITPGGFDFGLKHLSSLKEAEIKIDCFAASTGEGNAAEAAIRNAAMMLPNNPSLDIKRFSADDDSVEEDFCFIVEATTNGRWMQQRMARQAEP